MKRQERLACCLAVCILASMMWGCGGGSGSSSGPTQAVSVSITSPTSSPTLDEGKSAQVKASVANDSSGSGVTWTLSGSGALSNETTSSVTYTAPSQVVSPFTATLTATSVADSSKSASLTVTVVVPPQVTTTSLADGAIGTAYSQTLAASGGITPYTWSLNGALPAGLSFYSTGTISGTPTAAGTSSFSVGVTDAGGLSATKTLNIVVPSGSGGETLAIGTTQEDLPGGLVNKAYDYRLWATGGTSPYTFSILTIAGQGLPDGLAISPAGEISGAPTAAGTSYFTVQVTDGATPPATARAYFYITVTGTSGVNNSEFSGQYAFLFNGFRDSDNTRLASVGSLQVDGCGNITGGVEDVNTASGRATSVAFTGTYSIGADHRGTMALTVGSSTLTFAVAVGSIDSGVAGKVQFIETDSLSGGNQHGSGVMMLQAPAAFSGGLSGGYAFGLMGETTSASIVESAGVFTADGGGNITAGTTDTEQAVSGEATSASTNLSISSGSCSTPAAATGRATVALPVSGAPAGYPRNFVLYVVDADHAFILSADSHAGSTLLSGTVRKQKLAAFDAASLSGPFVVYAAGGNSNGEFWSQLLHGAGDGAGGYTVDASDRDDNGTHQHNGATGTFSVSVGSNGRTSGGSGNPVFYLFDTNAGFFLDLSGSGDGNFGAGYLEAQQAGPYDDAYVAGSYALGTLPPLDEIKTNESGVLTMESSGDITGATDDAGEYYISYDDSIAAAIASMDSSTGVFTVADEPTCYIVSPTKSACIGQNDSKPSVMLLER